MASYVSLISPPLGCLFHFGQAVWRNVQSNGLSKKYSDDETFRLNVKKLIALAFAPWLTSSKDLNLWRLIWKTKRMVFWTTSRRLG